MADSISISQINFTMQELFPNYWESSPRAIPFLGGLKVKIVLGNSNAGNDTLFADMARVLLESFFQLEIDDRNKLSNEVYKNCTEYLEVTGFDLGVVESFRSIKNPEKWQLNVIQTGHLLALSNVNKVWDFVYPREIYIKKEKNGKTHLRVLCECQWEEEHGLQILFKSRHLPMEVGLQDF